MTITKTTMNTMTNNNTNNEYEKLVSDIEAKITADNEDVMIAAIQAVKYKAFMESLSNKGLMIANWHLNGDLEPIESFLDSAKQEGRGVAEHIEETLRSPLGNEEYFQDISDSEYTVEHVQPPPILFNITGDDRKCVDIDKAVNLYQFFATLICRANSRIYRVDMRYLKCKIMADANIKASLTIYFHDYIKPLLEFINSKHILEIFDTRIIAQDENTYIDFCINREREQAQNGQNDIYN